MIKNFVHNILVMFDSQLDMTAIYSKKVTISL